MAITTLFQPKAHFNNIYEITPNYLKHKGISCVILDIDNTLVPYSAKTPGDDVSLWVSGMINSGIKVVIMSNAKVQRADEFVKNIILPDGNKSDIMTVGKAGKPLKRGFKAVAKKTGIAPDKMCIIGDQIFTDIWGGNRNGVFSIWVTPIEHIEPAFVRFKRVFEKPVTHAFERKFKKKGQANTGLLGLIGYPVGHSVSPQIQNTINEVAGYNFYYDKFEVKPEELEGFFYDLKNKGFRGFNVTVPHKESIMKYLDEIDEEAAKVGAVNTVVFSKGKAYGYNTDINGFALAMEEPSQTVSPNCTLNGAQVLILGAGGAARGVAQACLKNGAASIDFSNRTISKAKELAELFGGGIADAGDKYFSNKFNEYDIIINTTSAGMKPQEDMMPLSYGEEVSFRKGQICVDLIYSPEKTLFLQKAEREGAQIINGRGMLFWQAVEAFNIWAAEAGCKKVTEEQIKKIKELLGDLTNG